MSVPTGFVLDIKAMLAQAKGFASVSLDVLETDPEIAPCALQGSLGSL
jgi:hypothetical protein